MFEKVDFIPGKVIWETPGLYTAPGAERNPHDLMNWYLREEMAYISYPDNYFIDVGWNRRDSDEWWAFVDKVEQKNLIPTEQNILFLGEFHITIIKNEDNWTDQNKIFYSCVLIDDLDALMKIAINRLKILLPGIEIA